MTSPDEPVVSGSDPAVPPGNQAVELPAKAVFAGEEVDLWWGGFAGRTMLPSFLISGLLTVVIVEAAYYLWAEQIVEGSPARYGVYGAAGTVWLVQLFRWIYRLAGFNYRLTTHRLFCNRGFLFPVISPVSLKHLEEVSVEQSFLQRFLGVGRVRILADARTSPVILEGVSRPHQIADLIHAHAEKAGGKRGGYEAPAQGRHRSHG